LQKRIVLAVIIVAGLLIAVAGGYLLWAFATDNPPFCSGYPPGGDCPGKYSYAFEVDVNYSGPWNLSYFGYHNGGNPASGVYLTVGATYGNFTGTGDYARSITISGSNKYPLYLCAQAEKLDQSNLTLTLAIGPDVNNTNLPATSAYVCQGVAP